jgi:tetratricopeptide (TPR) repeat protein
VHAKAILGVAYAKEGRQEEAIAKLDEAWQVINSEGFEDVPLKAYVSVMRTKYRVPPGGECDCSDDQDSLIEVLAKPHVSNRDVVNARMALAICYRRSAARNVQNPDEFFRLMNLACEHTRHVYESYGNDSTRFKAAATHATMLRDARRFEEAVDFIETNLPLAPDNHVGRLELELAGAQIGLGNIEEGLTLIQSGKAKMPAELEHRTQGYLFACGVALQNQAFFKEAHALFEEAIERASVKSTSVPKDTKQMFYERAASSALAHAKAKPSAESTDFLRLALETAESRYAESKTQGTLSKKREGNFSQLIAQIYVALDDHEAATVWNEVSQREKLDKQK